MPRRQVPQYLDTSSTSVVTVHLCPENLVVTNTPFVPLRLGVKGLYAKAKQPIKTQGIYQIRISSSE